MANLRWDYAIAFAYILGNLILLAIFGLEIAKFLLQIQFLLVMLFISLPAMFIIAFLILKKALPFLSDLLEENYLRFFLENPKYSMAFLALNLALVYWPMLGGINAPHIDRTIIINLGEETEISRGALAITAQLYLLFMLLAGIKFILGNRTAVRMKRSKDVFEDMMKAFNQGGGNYLVSSILAMVYFSGLALSLLLDLYLVIMSIMGLLPF